jgi:hypothetical protein
VGVSERTRVIATKGNACYGYGLSTEYAMKRLVALFSLILGLIVAPAVAQARGIPIPMKFGSDFDVSHLVDTKVTADIKGKPVTLSLGHKTSLEYFFAPYSVKSDGLVLYYHEGKNYYFMDIPEGEELKEWQTEGLLPDPLPEVSLDIGDYAFGYLLEIGILALILFGVFKYARKNREEAAQ